MNNDPKFVEFHKYCPSCKYQEKEGYEDPCNECLSIAARKGTEVPENYKKEE